MANLQIIQFSNQTKQDKKYLKKFIDFNVFILFYSHIISPPPLFNS